MPTMVHEEKQRERRRDLRQAISAVILNTDAALCTIEAVRWNIPTGGFTAARLCRIEDGLMATRKAAKQAMAELGVEAP